MVNDSAYNSFFNHFEEYNIGNQYIKIQVILHTISLLIFLICCCLTQKNTLLSMVLFLISLTFSLIMSFVFIYFFYKKVNKNKRVEFFYHIFPLKFKIYFANVDDVHDYGIRYIGIRAFYLICFSWFLFLYGCYQEIMHIESIKFKIIGLMIPIFNTISFFVLLHIFYFFLYRQKVIHHE